MHNHNMLEVNNLSKNFAGTGRETEFAAVDGISFTLDAGECLGLKKHDGPSDHRIGPGGCRQRSVGRRGNPRKKRQAAARSLPENTDGLPDPAGFF